MGAEERCRCFVVFVRHRLQRRIYLQSLRSPEIAAVAPEQQLDPAKASQLQAQNHHLLASIADLRQQLQLLRSAPAPDHQQNQELLLTVGGLRTENAQLKEQVELNDSAQLHTLIQQLRGELQAARSTTNQEAAQVELRAQNTRLLQTIGELRNQLHQGKDEELL